MLNTASPEKRIAMVSEHASPVAALGSEDAGGQNVYVAEAARHLARLGYHVDVFTRRDRIDAPAVSAFAPGVRLVYVNAGPAHFVKKDDMWVDMPQFRNGMLRFAAAQAGPTTSSTGTSGCRAGWAARSASGWVCRWCRSSTPWAAPADTPGRGRHEPEGNAAAAARGGGGGCGRTPRGEGG